MAAKHKSTLSDALELLAIAVAIAAAGYLAVFALTGCAASPRGETHQPTFVTDRPAPPGRQGYMATWPDGSVSMIEWDAKHD